MNIHRRSSDKNAFIMEVANKIGREAACERFGLTRAQMAGIFKTARERERKQYRNAHALAANAECA